MEISSAVSNTMSELVALGYRLTNVYSGDGTVRMSNGTVGIFVHNDGAVSPPHTNATQLAQAALAEAGFTMRFGRKAERERPMTDQEAAGQGPADPSIAA